MSADEPTSSVPGIKTAPRNRRTALQVFTGCLGLLLNVIPVSLGGLFFLDPLLRPRKSVSGGAGPDGFIKLRVNTDVIPDDGTPVSVTVIADQTDAWNRYKDVPIGSIWLRRRADGRLVAFNSTCPHLGCSVDYRGGNGDFYCPCHASSFDLDGGPLNDVPPREMDELDIFKATEGERDEAGTELWVRFQEFRGATDEQIPI